MKVPTVSNTKGSSTILSGGSTESALPPLLEVLGENDDKLVGPGYEYEGFLYTWDESGYMGTLMIDPTSKYVADSQLGFDGYWKLISPVYVSSAGNPIDRSISYTYDITETESVQMSKTLGTKGGIEWGVKDKAGVYEAHVKASIEVSESTTNSFGTSTSITTSETVTDTFHWGQSYRNEFGTSYPPYIGGLYQLVGDYYITPGAHVDKLAGEIYEWGQDFAREISKPGALELARLPAPPDSIFSLGSHVSLPYTYSDNVYNLVEVYDPAYFAN
ncbi:hypothetical protein [Chengkuizengella marina]|uniref:hypothetical protein n=1 Tax=Chengkuizengella marina TaxID=2507566 RepID=UPI001368C035|nr:hypothetical protein [Chengkuizengella marina]